MVTVVPAGPVTLQLSVHVRDGTFASFWGRQLALKELMTGASAFGGTTVIQTVFWSLPAWLLTVSVQQPDCGGVTAIEPVKGTDRLSPPHVRKASPSPVISQLSTTRSPVAICVLLAVKELMWGGAAFGDRTVMQAVFWSLPAWLLAVRVQQPDWAGVIAIEPVKGTLCFSPSHSRVASPSPFIVQLSVTDSWGETCVWLAVKDVIAGFSDLEGR